MRHQYTTGNADAMSRHQDTGRMFAIMCFIVVLGIQEISHATPVSIYNGPLYADPNSSSAIQNILKTNGHTATFFTGTPPANLSNIPDSLFVDIVPNQFDATDVILFPSSVNLLLDNRLTANSVAILRKAVEGQGKGLVAVGNGSIGLLNRIFFTDPPDVYSSTGTGGPSTLSAEAVGTPFEGGPDTLTQPADGAMNPFAFTPTGHVNLYRDANGGATVFTAPFGNGQLGFLGWNFTPEQDADWDTVLNSMVTAFESAEPIPEPATFLLMAGPLGGLLVGRFLRKGRRTTG